MIEIKLHIETEIFREDKGWRGERIRQNTWILRKHPAGGGQIHNSFADGFYGRYERRLERICGFD